MVSEKIFSCNISKNNCGGDEGVSNIKKSQSINTTSSMTKSPSSMTKAAAAAKKKAGKVDLFQLNFTKSWFHCTVYCCGGLLCARPPFFISFFDA
jgi:hypothetical protein